MILTVIIPAIMAALNFGVAITFLLQKRYDWATVYFSYFTATIALIFCAQNKFGLNGYTPEEMAEVYSGEIPDNVYFDKEFAKLLKKEIKKQTSLTIPILTQIVHCKKGKFTKYIGRPKAGQPWGFGNPFVIDSDGDRAKVINRMKEWLDTGETFGNVDATQERRRWILDNIQSLRGEVLGCWCDYPKEDCHGRILINKISELIKPTLITNNPETLAIIYNLPPTQSNEDAVRSILKQNEK